MSLHLYDTYAREVREFVPLQEGEVGMYACGPTVYDYAHIGNLRTYVFEDVLRRVLEFGGYRVRHVMNITDVGHLVSDADSGEDKMVKGARRRGMSAWEIAEEYTRAFEEDLRALNILPPTVWCRATEHIAEQIADIEKIERAGFTYRTGDGIYFDTSRLEGYGYLARLDVEGLAAGARVEVGEKRRGCDFALWKFSGGEKRQMEWDSPWGRGFPGWHIECSAMAVKYLGKKFDIHCGGKDHIPIHHCNEIAQAEVCYGTRLANFWVHGYFLEVDAGRMAKSAGEFLRVESLRERGYDALAFRYLCLTANYRSDLKFSWESLDGAAAALGRLRGYVEGGEGGEADEGVVEAFREAVEQDLNTAKGLAVLWEMVKGGATGGVKRATLLRCDGVLGLDLINWKGGGEGEIPQEVLALVKAREGARAGKDWGEADRLRGEIEGRGFLVEDGAGGSVVRRG